MAKPALPISTVEEFVASAKNNPGKLSYATAGQGSLHQLAGELLKSQTNALMVHVPYRGSSASLIDAAGGQIDLAVATVAPALGLIKEGRVKPLATTSAKRLAVLPNVPTIHEKTVPGYDVSGWFGFLGPGNLSGPIVHGFEAAKGRVNRLRNRRASATGLVFGARWAPHLWSPGCTRLA